MVKGLKERLAAASVGAAVAKGTAVWKHTSALMQVQGKTLKATLVKVRFHFFFFIIKVSRVLVHLLYFDMQKLSLS